MAENEEHKDGHAAEGGHSGGGHGGGQHSGGGHEEHEGAPEWLISFADNVALMMGFFVILLAMNMQKPKAGGIGGEDKMGGSPTIQMIDFVIAMRKEFNNPIDLNSDNPAEEIYRKRIRDLQAGRSSQVDEPGPEREHQAIRPTDFSNFGGKVYFEDDAAALNDRAREQAQKIGARLKGQRYIVEVRGHVSPSEAQSNPERAFNLAHARALAVFKELVVQGVDAKQIRISAAADNERTTPREHSYDREADRQNQRVEVIMTNEVFTARELLLRQGDSDPKRHAAEPNGN